MASNGTEKAAVTTDGKVDRSDDAAFIETLERSAPGYGMERSSDTAMEIIDDENNNPNIHHHVRRSSLPYSASPPNFSHVDLISSSR